MPLERGADLPPEVAAEAGLSRNFQDEPEGVGSP